MKDFIKDVRACICVKYLVCNFWENCMKVAKCILNEKVLSIQYLLMTFQGYTCRSLLATKESALEEAERELGIREQETSHVSTRFETSLASLEEDEQQLEAERAEWRQEQEELQRKEANCRIALTAAQHQVSEFLDMVRFTAPLMLEFHSLRVIAEYHTQEFGMQLSCS